MEGHGKMHFSPLESSSHGLYRNDSPTSEFEVLKMFSDKRKSEEATDGDSKGKYSDLTIEMLTCTKLVDSGIIYKWIFNVADEHPCQWQKPEMNHLV